MRAPEDSLAEVIGLVQRIAFGVVLIAAALIDWQRFRWWWSLITVFWNEDIGEDLTLSQHPRSPYPARHSVA